MSVHARTLVVSRVKDAWFTRESSLRVKGKVIRPRETGGHAQLSDNAFHMKFSHTNF